MTKRIVLLSLKFSSKNANFKHGEREKERQTDRQTDK